MNRKLPHPEKSVGLFTFGLALASISFGGCAVSDGPVRGIAAIPAMLLAGGTGVINEDGFYPTDTFQKLQEKHKVRDYNFPQSLGEWHPLPPSSEGPPPGSFRVISGATTVQCSQLDYPDAKARRTGKISVEISNTSSKALKLVGLATSTQSASFIDLKQPGAFELSLYPGKSAIVLPDPSVAPIEGHTVWVKIQAWASVD